MLGFGCPLGAMRGIRARKLETRRLEKRTARPTVVSAGGESNGRRRLVAREGLVPKKWTRIGADNPT